MPSIRDHRPQLATLSWMLPLLASTGAQAALDGVSVAPVPRLLNLSRRPLQCTCPCPVPSPPPAGSSRLGLPSPAARIDADSGDVLDGGKDYLFVVKPTPQQRWVRDPWISRQQSYGGRPSIALELLPAGMPQPADATSTTNDKAHLRIATVPRDKPLYLGFAMRLDANYFMVPDRNLLLAQVWQGSPYGPPLALRIRPGDANYGCFVSIRNEQTGGNPGAQTVDLPLGNCTPGRWHLFRMEMRAHHASEPGVGRVVVWHDDMQHAAASWTGNVGYDPSRPVNVNGQPGHTQSQQKPKKTFDFHIGPYRDRQAVRHRVFYASVRVADSLQDADPTA